MSNSEISFYVDTLLVEAVLGEPQLYKQAGFVSDLLSKVKGYFDSKVDKENPAASIINILAPGTLWTVFRAMGMGTWGMFLGLLMNVFHVDAYGILVSLYNKVKAMISGNNKVSSSQIDDAINSTAQEHMTETTPDQAEEGFNNLQKMQTAKQVESSLDLIHDAKMIRLAMVQYEHETLRLTKTAISRGNFLSSFSGTRGKGTNILARIFGWVFKMALMSAGLMVAGDVVRKFVGMDHPSGTEAPVEQGSISTQKKYQLKGDAPLPRSLPVTNNPFNIDNIIIQFAKDVYSGLDGKEGLIRNTPGFQAIKEKITWFNIRNVGSALTFIPQQFTSKKQLADYFIDDVAKADK